MPCLGMAVLYAVRPAYPVKGDPPEGPGCALTLSVRKPGWLTLGDLGLTSTGDSGPTKATCAVQLALSQRRRALTHARD